MSRNDHFLKTQSYRIFFKNKKSFFKIKDHEKIISEKQKFLERHPKIARSDKIEVDELIKERILKDTSTETNSTKSNTVLSIPSPFTPTESSIYLVTHKSEVISKTKVLPELFNLLFFESQFLSGTQLEVIYEMIMSKDPHTASKVYAVNRYYAQFDNNFHIRGNGLWQQPTASLSPRQE